MLTSLHRLAPRRFPQEPGRDRIVLEYEGTLAVVVFRADLLPDGALIFENKICQSPPSVELARFLARCCFLPLLSHIF